ncbi:MAG: metal ABC transporter permease [Candidatus Heimdallarchaeota archaeon]|nr:metal ABC transporter permease [Candidatus Heimdallarchaeota archaeon]MCK5048336.1 metal ABC transporter permease [Candidatus Heimdallarchaeota archaeon]
MATIYDFFDAMSLPWMQRAMVTAIIIGIVCSLIGVFVLLRGLVFLGEAIAHSAFAGAALGLLLGINPIWTIMLFGTGTALGIGYVNEKKVMNDEIIIGVIFSFFMALAILFISLMKRYSTDINSILFGNILIISVENFLLLIFLSVITLGMLFMIKKELYFMTFDAEMAQISGIPVRFLNYLFLIMVSLTIDVSLRAIGAILVFAALITPAAAAYQFTFNINKMLLLAVTFGIFSSVIGLIASFLLDLPSGSTIVILSTSIFLISFIFSPKRRAKLHIDECPFCKDTINQEVDENCEEECFFKDVNHIHSHNKVWVHKSSLPTKSESLKDPEHLDVYQSEEEK